MKKFKFIFLFALCMCFIPNICALGEFAVGDTRYDTISAALKNVENGGTITMMGDYDSGSTVVNYVGAVTKKVTLDLNGYELSGKSNYGILYVSSGDLTIEDNSETKTGKITSKNNKQALSLGNGAKATINGGTIYSPNYGLYLYLATTESDGNTLIVNGGTIYGVYYGIAAFDYDTVIINDGTVKSNGYVLLNNGGSSNESTFTINGGTLTQLDNDHPAIYHPGVGNLTINGGTISGGTGVEMRAGNLTIPSSSTATIIADVSVVDVTPNGNGATTLGSAVAISQHSTKKAINVNIAGGTFKGFSALYQSNPEKNGQESINKISINVTGGDFDAINNGTQVVYSENFEDFITGGTYNIEANKKYILYPYESVLKSNKRYNVEIVAKNNIEVIDTTKQSEDVVIGVESEEQEKINDIVVELIESEEELFDKVKGYEIEIALETSEATDVESKKEFEEKLEKDSKILGYYDIDINIYEKGTNNLLSSITELPEKVKITVLIPKDFPAVKEGYERSYSIVREHDGQYDLIEATVSEDGKYLEFESDKFSQYLIAYKDELKTINNPETKDNFYIYIISFIITLILSLCGIRKFNQIYKKA